MYAVIKTGGKQYRVQPGDVLVVEKLDGDVGASVSFDQVLMVGGDDGVTIGAPVVEGALVHATLVETRRGEKIKIFKKTRRQGYRRTRGHRQSETVLRVTGLEAAGETHKWDGKVDLTPLSVLNARARNLAARGEAEVVVEAPPAPVAKKAAAPKKAAAEPAVAEPHVETVVEASKDSPVVKAAVVETNAPDVEADAAPAAPKKPRAKKAAPAADDSEA
jgi:large subunit ribosomal protein L21